jgi:hypothetical protein
MLHHLHAAWQHPGRPIGVTFAALTAGLMGILMLALAIAIFIVSLQNGTGQNTSIQLLILALFLALSVALFGIGYGLLQLNLRAYQISIILLGLGLATEVIEMIQQGRIQLNRLGIVWALIYLLLPSVRRAFAAHKAV